MGSDAGQIEDVKSRPETISHTAAAPLDAALLDASALARDLKIYRSANNRRGLVELAITLIPFVGLWIATLLLVQAGYWIALFLSVPAAGFLVRLFLIQHDCGHGSFFRQRRVNNVAGRLLGVLTLTPYSYWRHTHAVHHASHGNLDRRGMGEVFTHTVSEYRALPWRRRFLYRLFRHPLFIFGLAPTYLFIVQYRAPMGMLWKGWNPWISVIGTNLGIAAVTGLIIWLVGIEAFLLVHGPIAVIAATIGVWLFYVQHQFEQTTWEKDSNWNWHDAAFHGSSYYDLPAILRWFTANIGLHHIHHLCSGIPFYRLREALRSNPALLNCSRMTFGDSLRTVNLVLWDEQKRRLVTFREARLPANETPRQ